MREQFITSDTELVSFDLWLTLIKSDGKTFKSARNEMLRDHLAPGADMAGFDEMVRAIDRQADKLAETRGDDVMFDERVTMIAEVAGSEAPDEDLIAKLYVAQTKLFEQTPPALLDPNTPQLLKNLGIERKLAVISNTGFIHGREMRAALGQLGILDSFSFAVFSNEIGYAKPDQRIFGALTEQSDIAPEHTTHIGDNPRADVAGAEAAGMRAILFGSDVTLQSIVEYAKV